MAPLILLTNDDGIHSPGLAVLKDALVNLGRVVVVAPLGEQSACSRSITLHRPLRMGAVGEDSYYVDGTPADCVQLALKKILLHNPPDLVISGINKGANLGEDVVYSGTVAAALEAHSLGINALAVSEVYIAEKNAQTKLKFSFVQAAGIALSVARKVLNAGKRLDAVLNLNIPNFDLQHLKGIEVTTLGSVLYSKEILEREDPRGNRYYWIGGEKVGFGQVPGTDSHAVWNNAISLTPLVMDLMLASQQVDCSAYQGLQPELFGSDA